MYSSIRKTVSVIVLVTFTVWPLRGYSLPSGEQVVEGSASFDRSTPDTLNITQATDKLIADYDSFSIAQPETVRFLQPSSSSIALNRVVGVDPSVLLGTLTANGRIFLVNPNGVLFGQGCRVDAAGLVASTLNINNADFMAGRYTFFGAGGSVVNQGYISAPGGYVALLGSNVLNAGVIEANLGSIALAGGKAMTLGLDPKGMINIVVDEASVSNTAGADDAVKNSGTLKADAGKVLLTAKTLDGVFKKAVNNTGIIEAQGLAEKNGEVVLLATGANGLAATSGSIDVSGKAAGAAGGKVEVSGDRVNVGGTIDVSGNKAANGLLYIDPNDVYVLTSAYGLPDVTDSYVLESVLEANTGSFSLSSNHDIYFDLVDNELNLAGLNGADFTTSAPGDLFSINARNSIDFADTMIRTNGGSVAVYANNGYSGGNIYMSPGSGIITNGGNINLNAANIYIDGATLRAIGSPQEIGYDTQVNMWIFANPYVLSGDTYVPGPGGVYIRNSELTIEAGASDPASGYGTNSYAMMDIRANSEVRIEGSTLTSKKTTSGGEASINMYAFQYNEVGTGTLGTSDIRIKADYNEETGVKGASSIVQAIVEGDGSAMVRMTADRGILIGHYGIDYAGYGNGGNSSVLATVTGEGQSEITMANYYSSRNAHVLLGDVTVLSQIGSAAPASGHQAYVYISEPSFVGAMGSMISSRVAGSGNANTQIYTTGSAYPEGTIIEDFEVPMDLPSVFIDASTVKSEVGGDGNAYTTVNSSNSAEGGADGGIWFRNTLEEMEEEPILGRGAVQALVDGDGEANVNVYTGNGGDIIVENTDMLARVGSNPDTASVGVDASGGFQALDSTFLAQVLNNGSAYVDLQSTDDFSFLGSQAKAEVWGNGKSTVYLTTEDSPLEFRQADLSIGESKTNERSTILSAVYGQRDYNSDFDVEIYATNDVTISDADINSYMSYGGGPTEIRFEAAGDFSITDSAVQALCDSSNTALVQINMNPWMEDNFKGYQNETGDIRIDNSTLTAWVNGTDGTAEVTTNGEGAIDVVNGSGLLAHIGGGETTSSVQLTANYGDAITVDNSSLRAECLTDGTSQVGLSTSGLVAVKNDSTVDAVVEGNGTANVRVNGDTGITIDDSWINAAVYFSGIAQLGIYSDGDINVLGASSLISTTGGLNTYGSLTFDMVSDNGAIIIDGQETLAHLETSAGSGNALMRLISDGIGGISLVNADLAAANYDNGWAYIEMIADSGPLSIGGPSGSFINAYSYDSGDSRIDIQSETGLTIDGGVIGSSVGYDGDAEIYLYPRTGDLNIVGSSEITSYVGESGFAGVMVNNYEESNEWHLPFATFEVHYPIPGDITIGEGSYVHAEVGNGIIAASAGIVLNTDAGINITGAGTEVSAQENHGEAGVLLMAGKDIQTEAATLVSAKTNENRAGVAMLADGSINAQGQVTADAGAGIAGVALLAAEDVTAAKVTAAGESDGVGFLEHLIADEFGQTVDVGLAPLGSGIVLGSLVGNITMGNIMADMVFAVAPGVDDWFSEDDIAGYGGIFSTGLVKANWLAMMARNDIGTADAPIETQVDTLSAYSYEKGDVYINEADDLEVGAIIPLYADIADDVKSVSVSESEGEGDGIIPMEIGLSVAARDGIVHIESGRDILVNSIIAPKGGVYLESREGSIYAGRGWDPVIDENDIENAGEMAAFVYTTLMDDEAKPKFYSDLIRKAMMPLGEGYYYTPIQVDSPLNAGPNVIAGGYSYLYTPNGTIGVGSIYDSGRNPDLSGEVTGIVRPNTDSNAFAFPTVGLDPDRLPPAGVFYDENDAGVQQVYPNPGGAEGEVITPEMSNPLWVDIRVLEGAASAAPVGFIPQAGLTLAFGASPAPVPPVPTPDTAVYFVQPFKTISVYYEQNNGRNFSTPNQGTVFTLLGYRPLVSASMAAFDAMTLDAGAYDFISNNINLKKSLAPFFGQMEDPKKKK